MTEFSDEDAARWFWAIAQTAPLSMAESIRLPVLIRDWVVLNASLVALRFCRATIAPTLVLIEFGMLILFLRDRPSF